LRFRDSLVESGLDFHPFWTGLAVVPLFAFILTELTAELALFAAVGFLLFGIDDLIVDLIYFMRRGWRAAVVYSRHPKMFAGDMASPMRPGWMAVLVPAWDEANVIASMLRATLERFGTSDYRLFVGHYRNDPATRAAILSVEDPRVTPVDVGVDGPTTKADCLNRLYSALVAHEAEGGRTAKAVGPAAGGAVARPQLAVGRRPLRRRVRRSAYEGTGGARSGRSGDPPGRSRLRDRAGGAVAIGRPARRPPIRRHQHDRGL
jgi:hypothetical protein